MATKLIPLFFSGLILCANICIANPNKDHILWITWEQRPIFVSPPEGGPLEGIYQDIINYLHDQPDLKHYQQKQIFVNHSRFNRVAQSPDNCYLGWVTYDDKRIESLPVTLIKPWVIWTSKKNQAQFGKPDSLISLEQLILNPDIKVGIIMNFTYSQPVLELLNKHKGNPSIVTANTSAIEINPRTLDAGRVDVFLGNPGQMQRRRSDPIPDLEYIKYGIMEDNNHREMLVSCADDKKGQQVIKAVNNIITSDPDKFYQQILSYHDQWLGEVTNNFLTLFKENIHSVNFQTERKN